MASGLHQNQLHMEPETAASPRFALFGYGFRPFFLFAAFYAAIAVPVWVGIWRGDLGWMPAMPANLWHGHEMIFGFAVAALAGFMLTAVPNWTGAAAIKGPPLMLLVGVWVAGRIAAFLPWPSLFAVVDLAFLPLLAVILGPGILIRNGRRNSILVGILLLLAAVNGVIHFDGYFDGWGMADLSGGWGLNVAIAIFALLIGIIGGRIVPAFTQGGMKMAGVPFVITAHRVVDPAAVLSLVLNLLVNLLQAPEPVLGGAALLAAACNLLRFLRWQGWKTWPVPLVWILHIGYAWLIIGLVLTSVTDLTGTLSPTMGRHALTAGAFSTMILAVMSRAALGHTGRQLVASRKTVGAYMFLTAAVFFRVIAPLCGDMETTVVEAAALLWSAAFLIFGILYLPILVLARPDGRPG
ncbi:MAG: NnrS family protein [Rhodospirillaceae bacterium]|nr:NnrS family protein [Rhodospirillaceae bacterium]